MSLEKWRTNSCCTRRWFKIVKKSRLADTRCCFFFSTKRQWEWKCPRFRVSKEPQTNGEEWEREIFQVSSLRIRTLLNQDPLVVFARQTFTYYPIGPSLSIRGEGKYQLVANKHSRMVIQNPLKSYGIFIHNGVIFMIQLYSHFGRWNECNNSSFIFLSMYTL